MGHKWSSHSGISGGGDFYVSPMYAATLSHDRQTEVVIGNSDKNEDESSNKTTVRIGPRDDLPYMDIGNSRHQDIFKRLGIVVKTSGSRLMQNAEVVITDYYRLDGKRLVARNRSQGTEPTTWHGIKGPAEASGGLRVGDTLYAINHQLIVNKSKRQLLRQINSLLEKNSSVILTWRHNDEIDATPWELEVCLPPPEGNFVQLENEWGSSRPNKISSISI